MTDTTTKQNIPQDLTSIVIRPRITEKASLVMEKGVYVFEVSQRATKSEIAKSVETIYGVKPRKVNVVTMSPRKFMSKMRGRRGMKSGMKKAYVYLKEGDSIQLV